MVATSTKLRITENNADQQNLAKTFKRPVIGDPWGKGGGGGGVEVKHRFLGLAV